MKKYNFLIFPLAFVLSFALGIIIFDKARSDSPTKYPYYVEAQASPEASSLPTDDATPVASPTADASPVADATPLASPTADATAVASPSSTAPPAASPVLDPYAPELFKVKARELTMKLSWTKVKKANQYQIYRKKKNGKKFKKIAITQDTTFVDETVLPRETYSYKIKSRYKSGKKNVLSSFSNEKTDKISVLSKIKKIKAKGSPLYGKKVKLFYDAYGHVISHPEKLFPSAPSLKGPYEIYVNKSKNQVLIYSRKKSYYVPVRNYLCSVGPITPTGSYSLGERYRWRSLVQGYQGQWSVRITGHFLFHSVPYYSANPNNLATAEYNKLGTTCSHGCIRMQAGACEWLYRNCPAGTPVRLYFSSAKEPLKKPKLVKIQTTYDPTDPEYTPRS